MLGAEELTADGQGGDGVLRPRRMSAGPGVTAAGDVGLTSVFRKAGQGEEEEGGRGHTC